MIYIYMIYDDIWGCPFFFGAPQKGYLIKWTHDDMPWTFGNLCPIKPILFAAMLGYVGNQGVDAKCTS